MKAFKQHWNKEIAPYIHNPADVELAEYWWKAALEWVKREAISLDERGDISRSIIDRELKIDYKGDQTPFEVIKEKLNG